MISQFPTHEKAHLKLEFESFRLTSWGCPRRPSPRRISRPRPLGCPGSRPRKIWRWTNFFLKK